MFFVEFYGWFEDDDWLYLSMEYFEYGDLGNYFDGKCWTESNAKILASQLLEGLQVMHKQGFAHRDLKPAVSL